MRGVRAWGVLGAIVLIGGLTLPVPAGAKGDRDDREEHKQKGGVCSPIPNGCRKEDCRCEDEETCVECRAFVCRREKKQAPSVLCSPCCKKKDGKIRCRPAPDEDYRKCVPSPS